MRLNNYRYWGVGLICSRNGKSSYSSIFANDSKVYFTRKEKDKKEEFDFSKLYTFYCNGINFTTTEAKSFKLGGVQSPAIAILDKVFEFEKDIIKTPSSTDKNYKETKEVLVPKETKKDEQIFLEAFAEVIGENYLYSKSINNNFDTNWFFLSKNYRDYGFEDKITNCYDQILQKLESSKELPKASLASNVDGFIFNHKVLGIRIVEFDEELHFTPARLITLELLTKIINSEYFDRYIETCNDFTYFQNQVLKKHRVKLDFETQPTFEYLIKRLINSTNKESGFIKPKTNFEYLGGRIAQRAYYDTLRDTAHLSPKNNLKETIRFSKKEFEDYFKVDFHKISKANLVKYLKERILIIINKSNKTL